MTIPITDAIRAVKIHIAMCDADVKEGGETAWILAGYGRHRSADFIDAARAGYKATLEYLLDDLENSDSTVIPAAVRPLVEHLDATRPNWRTDGDK